MSGSPKVTGQVEQSGPGSAASCVLSSFLRPTGLITTPGLPLERGGREVEILADEIPTEITAPRRIPIRWHQRSQLGVGWHPTEDSVAEGPLQRAAGAVGDEAPRGRGRELKLAPPAGPAPTRPAGAPTLGLLLGNLQRAWGVRGLELGVREHDPIWLSS